MSINKLIPKSDDVQIHILADDGSWNVLNRFITENRKLDEFDGVVKEEKRDKLIHYAETLRDAWINTVFENRVLKVIK
jgi:hypothetical protein